MAQVSELPCNGDGICMVCNNIPATEETLTCNTCVTPWHVICIRPDSLLQSLSDVAQWDCPDCSLVNPAPGYGNQQGAGGSKDDSSGSLIAAIKATEADKTLSEQEKAMRRQLLLSGSAGPSEGDGEKKAVEGDNDLLRAVNKSLSCSICLQTLERPVTTPCGHNFCLKCFQKWIAQGKRSCANCRNAIPSSMATQPRINSTLVFAIRMAKMSNSNTATGQKVSHFVHNQDRPEKAFTSEHAKKAGKANASSGRIFVTIPSDHFGPILKENDPLRNQGVLVGESWEGRLECRQWGIHFPPVAGIAGQSAHGAQSVVLSGGYVDDEDHGEWFLYTGSGGRDLSCNRRTNKDQSSDQEFVKMNEALRVSCRNGYPVRVVRSFKEKRSAYAPVNGLRYDGIYRIENCWRKNGMQGYKVCRYLFVRCDNDPAPWSSDVNGDRPRPLPVITELENAINITERKESPFWDYDVNRELMGIIESLQRDIAKSENLEDSSEGTRGTSEKKDAVSDDTEGFEVNTQILEKAEDGGDEESGFGTAKMTLLEQPDAGDIEMGVDTVELKMVNNKELNAKLDQKLEPTLQEGVDDGSNDLMDGGEEMPKRKRAKIEVTV